MTKCAICGKRKCVDNTTKHLLGSFDASYDGQGLHGCGLSGGALYDVDDIGSLVDAIQEARVAAWQLGGPSAPPPTWITQHPSIAAYFASLGDEGFDLSLFQDTEEAVSFIGAYTESHGERLRELLEALLRECGWDEITTTEDDDGSLAPSSWILWWDADAEGLANRLGNRISEILSAVPANAAPISDTQRTAEQSVTVAPANTPVQPTSSEHADHETSPRCPICQKPDTECREHVLAGHLFPSGGNGLDGQLADEEIEALLSAVRLAWVRSVRDKEVPMPVPPAWVLDEPALRDYFFRLGPARDLDLHDDEDDEDAAERLRELPWDHSQLVRDFLKALLPECGWEGIVTEIPSEPDEETGIECLGALTWCSADPQGVTERLRTRLLIMLAKAEPVSGQA